MCLCMCARISTQVSKSIAEKSNGQHSLFFGQNKQRAYAGLRTSLKTNILTCQADKNTHTYTYTYASTFCTGAFRKHNEKIFFKLI